MAAAYTPASNTPSPILAAPQSIPPAITGATYTELVQQKRMRQAAYLLETSGLTVADIAVAVGYENVSYFHRLFQKTYGISPRKYRTAKRTDKEEKNLG